MKICLKEIKQLTSTREVTRSNQTKIQYIETKQSLNRIEKSVGETLKPLVDSLDKLVRLTEKNNIREATRVKDVILQSTKIEQSKNKVLSEKYDG